MCSGGVQLSRQSVLDCLPLPRQPSPTAPPCSSPGSDQVSVSGGYSVFSTLIKVIKEIILSPVCVLGTFFKDRLTKCVDWFLGSVMFPWSVCLFLSLYYNVLIIIALKYILKLHSMMLPSLFCLVFFLFKIALTIWCLCGSMWILGIFSFLVLWKILLEFW